MSYGMSCLYRAAEEAERLSRASTGPSELPWGISPSQPQIWGNPPVLPPSIIDAGTPGDHFLVYAKPAYTAPIVRTFNTKEEAHKRAAEIAEAHRIPAFIYVLCGLVRIEQKTVIEDFEE